MTQNKTLSADILSTSQEHSAAIHADMILRSIGELIYAWEIRHDRMHWNGDAVSVLQTASVSQITTGSAFQRLLTQEASAKRYDAIFNSKKADTGSGVSFKLNYAIEAVPSRMIWVEDKGRWFADRSGSPYLVHGSIKIAEAPNQHFTNETGVLTRDGLKYTLETMLNAAKETKQKTALIMAGVHNLGQINRSYGFELADEVVDIMGKRLKSILRIGDEIGRYAGNKFAILLKNCNDEELKIAANRLLEIAHNSAIETRQGAVAVSLKCGAAMTPDDGLTSVDLLQGAEEALMMAKIRGDTNYIFSIHHKSNGDQFKANQKSSDEIIQALNDRRIILAYQPIADANTRKIKYYEGLVRMRHLDGRIAGAGEIIPPAERLGLLKHIDMRVIELAAEELSKDKQSRLSINVDVSSLMSSEWMDMVSASLFAKRVEANRLVVEITETAMINDLATTTKAIHRLHEMGVQVALDDFGAGHTSFKTLRNMPINIVKIDGIFIHNLKISRDDRFFVSTLVNLAQHLGMKTVAEWVRDAETADILTNIGVDYLQGDVVGEALVDDDLRDRSLSRNTDSSYKAA